jgi:hypothetical protein
VIDILFTFNSCYSLLHDLPYCMHGHWQERAEQTPGLKKSNLKKEKEIY